MKALYFSAVLKDSVAPVWRRFVVPGNINFQDMHRILQVMFGYKNQADFEFFFNKPKIRVTMDQALYEQAQFFKTDEGKHYLAHRAEEGHEVDVSVEIVWAETAPIEPFVSQQQQFYYVYDFEDEWLYELTLLEVLDDVKEAPMVREGLGTAPFESVGGRDGYYELLEALTDPSHYDHEPVREWVETMGYTFYDKDDVNQALKHL